jgi:hypothetical protein
MPEEMRQKLSESHRKSPTRYWLGKKVLPHMREILSKARVGLEPWNKGQKMSAEIRAKFSKSHKGKKLSPGNEVNRIASLPKGAAHWNWRGGITPEMTKLRNSEDSNLWKRSVLKRDDYTCRKCGIRGRKLRCHHIVNWSDHPELRFLTDNGVALCDGDHREFHRRYGRKSNTREQLEEFLNADRSIKAA